MHEYQNKVYNGNRVNRKYAAQWCNNPREALLKSDKPSMCKYIIEYESDLDKVLKSRIR